MDRKQFGLDLSATEEEFATIQRFFLGFADLLRNFNATASLSKTYVDSVDQGRKVGIMIAVTQDQINVDGASL